MKKIYSSALAAVLSFAIFANASEDITVIKVGDDKVTYSDVEFLFSTVSNQSDMEKMDSKTFEEFQQYYANLILASQYLKEKGYDKDEDYHKLMELSRLQAAAGYVQDKYMEEHLNDEVLKEKYDELIGLMPETEERLIRHILVEEKDEEKAKKIIKDLQEGADFAKLAEENSIDTSSAVQGGQLNWAAKDLYVTEFAQAAWDAKKGELVANPVKSDFGWHIILVDDVRMQPKPTFEETKDYIRQIVMGEMQAGLLQAIQEGKEVNYFNDDGTEKEIPAATDTEAKQ